MPENISRTCETCVHCHKEQLPPPEIRSVSVCFFLPPTPFPLVGQGPNGKIIIAGQIKVRPQVSDTDTCAQWTPRPALTAQPANE